MPFGLNDNPVHDAGTCRQQDKPLAYATVDRRWSFNHHNTGPAVVHCQPVTRGLQFASRLTQAAFGNAAALRFLSIRTVLARFAMLLKSA